MRLLSAHLRSYRIHAECRIEFDSSRTLIGGANESGKSTIAEAIHRALFLRAKTTGEARELMQSRISAGHPEVEVDFACGERRYSVRKRFAGTAGTCLLTEHGGQTWNGEEAEERLAGLLGVAAPTGGRGAALRVAEQWAHLWVYQGSAGDDPTNTAAQQHTALVKRLGEIGNAAVMQSPRDTAVASAIALRHSTIFTKTGGYKKDSEVQRCIDAFADATARRRSCEDRIHRLEDAIRELEEAENTLRSSTSSSLEIELREAKEKKDRIDELKKEQSRRQEELESAEARHAEIERTNDLIAATRKTLAESRKELAPKEGKSEALRVELRSAEHDRSAAEDELRMRRDDVIIARRKRDLFSVHVDILRISEDLKALEIRRDRIAQQRGRRAEIARELSSLPAISLEQVASLKDLERNHDRADTSLRSMAAGFEVLSSNQPVRSVGREYFPGRRFVISEDTEISIGDDVSFRITPGGGASLSDMRREVARAREALDDALSALGVTDLETATEAAERRRLLQNDDNACVVALAEASAETLDDDSSDLKKRQSQRAGEVRRLEALGAHAELAQSVSAAEGDRLLADTDLQRLEEEEVNARNKLEQAEVLLANCQKAVELWEDALVDLRDSVRRLEADASAHERVHGSDEVRVEKTRISRNQVAAAATAALSASSALSNLEPEMVENDLLRLERAIRMLAEKREEANNRKIRAQALIQLDRDADPAEALASARAAELQTRREFELAEQRARAVELLRSLFAEKEQNLAARFTQPLLERVVAYLGVIFGKGVSVIVDYETGRLTGLRVSRAGYGDGAYDFDSLSGGTKEQVATAFRLAMAEILAADHDGSLPVVLDDAFAYSDGGRVQAVQRMLDLAASRGLQVIVLSCNPDEYAGFGAQQVRLPAVQVGQRSSAVSVRQRPVDEWDSVDRAVEAEWSAHTRAKDSSDSDASDVDPALAMPGARAKALLTVLRALGGSQGNGALRAELGWDEETYDVVKSQLLSEGRIKLGRGRGGSVSITSDE